MRIPASHMGRLSTLVRKANPGGAAGRTRIVTPPARPPVPPRSVPALGGGGGGLAPELVKIVSGSWSQGATSGLGTVGDFAFDYGTNTDGSTMSGLPSWISTADDSFFDLSEGVYSVNLTGAKTIAPTAPDGPYLTIDQSISVYVYTGATYTMTPGVNGIIEFSCTLPFFVPAGSTVSWSARFGHSHSSSVSLTVEATFMRLAL